MELYPGQVIHDIEQSAFGILVRRIGSFELLENSVQTFPFSVDELSTWQLSAFEIYAWEIVWSSGRHTVYSEDGLRNIIKCGTFVVVNGT
jgi:hypothetical protein